MAAIFKLREKPPRPPAADETDLGGEMSFLEHLDELRSRLIRIFIFVGVAAIGCWVVSGYIYNFLAAPVQRALAEAQRREVRLEGLTGQVGILPVTALNEQSAPVRFVFQETTRLGNVAVPVGASVTAQVGRNAQGKLALYSSEAMVTPNGIVPAGIKLPLDLNAPPPPVEQTSDSDKLIVTTALEPFSLYMKVALYAAVCLSIPFILFQIWGFISPGLYPHERGYVTPFVSLSSISFVIGAAFAYYVLFPPAATYLLGLGSDFRLLLKADDYFDFIILVMLAMGVVFQMPAITYVLSRIGLIDAPFLLRVWKTSLIVILIAAAVLSPTNDILNMALFALPMLVLYIISIFIAWAFGGNRRTSVAGD